MLAELVEDHGTCVVSAGVHDDMAVGVLNRGEDGRVKCLKLRAVAAVVWVGVDPDSYTLHFFREFTAPEVGILKVEVAESERRQVGDAFIAHRRESEGKGDGKFGFSAAEVSGHEDDAGTGGYIFREVFHV